MKTTITIEERNGRLEITYQNYGTRFTTREKRLVNKLVGAFPKNAKFDILENKATKGAAE